MIRVHVEVRPEGSDRVLYLARMYRRAHDGPFTETYKNRLTWEKVEYAARRIESEKTRGANRVHGHLRFTIVEEQQE